MFLAFHVTLLTLGRQSSAQKHPRSCNREKPVECTSSAQINVLPKSVPGLHFLNDCSSGQSCTSSIYQPC